MRRGLGAQVLVVAAVAANLAIAARQTHGWYRRRFPDYPAARRALVPGIW